MTRIIILKGLPASGKTTWARKFIEDYPDTIRINCKDIAQALLNKNVWVFIEVIIKSAINGKILVILDDCNLDNTYTEKVLKLSKKLPCEVIYQIMKVPLETAVNRDYGRHPRTGEQTIRGLFNNLLYPTKVCVKCGFKASVGVNYSQVSDYISGTCEVCGRRGNVLHPKFFGAPKF